MTASGNASRLILAAVYRLYFKEPPKELFEKNRYRVSMALMELPAPEKTKLQKLLSDTVEGDKAALYIGYPSPPVPSHYITLKRENDLWVVATPKVRHAQRQPKRGLLVYWGDYIVSDVHALTMPIFANRLGAQFAPVDTDNPHIQHLLEKAFDLAGRTQRRNSDKISIWFGRSRKTVKFPELKVVSESYAKNRPTRHSVIFSYEHMYNRKFIAPTFRDFELFEAPHPDLAELAIAARYIHGPIGVVSKRFFGDLHRRIVASQWDWEYRKWVGIGRPQLHTTAGLPTYYDQEHVDESGDTYYRMDADHIACEEIIDHPYLDEVQRMLKVLNVATDNVALYAEMKGVPLSEKQLENVDAIARHQTKAVGDIADILGG